MTASTSTTDRHACGKSKVEVYNWTMKDEPGTQHYIHKNLLNVDKEYQRTSVSWTRVNEIASSWSWKACGVLSVAKRPDSSLWVFDGQHRKLGADKRADITTLPCIVFDSEVVAEEAQAFYDVNTNRGNMPWTDKFRALIAANDPTAMQVKEMVESEGYTINCSGVPFTVRCAGALMTQFQKDKEIAQRIWRLCAALHAGEVIRDRIYSGLCHLETALSARGDETLLAKHNVQTLQNAGVDAIWESIASAVGFYKSGGAKVWAEGIVKLLNHKRKTRRIESLF